jgi:hypothetical protein
LRKQVCRRWHRRAFPWQLVRLTFSRFSEQHKPN